MGKDIREKKNNLLATKPPGLNRNPDLNPFFGSQPFTFTCVVYHAEKRRTPGDGCLALQPKAHFCGLGCYYCPIQRVPSTKENISTIN